jgi:hypothetical protein
MTATRAIVLILAIALLVIVFFMILGLNTNLVMETS